MTIDELRELLPFYAAGTLESNERELVEEALKNSEELRKELKSWSLAKQATNIHADMRSESHLTSEQIVDYANENVESGALRLSIENHLQSCTTCRKEYDIIKELQPPASLPATTRHVLGTMSSFFVRLRPRYVMMALALLAAILVVVLMREPRPQQAVNEPSKDSIIAPLRKETTRRSVALVFPYIGSVRDPGAKKESIPLLTIDQTTDTVDLRFPVQHSALASGYRIQIFSPVKRMLADDTVIAKVSGRGMDSVMISVDAGRLSPPGRYVVQVKELMKSRVPDVDPEEYRYEFEVRRAQGK